MYRGGPEGGKWKVSLLVSSYQCDPREGGPKGICQSMKYLECKSSSNTVGQDFCNDSVKCRQDLHRQLRFDPAIVDQVIESIGQSKAEANQVQVSSEIPPFAHSTVLHTCSHGTARSMTWQTTSRADGERFEADRGSVECSVACLWTMAGTADRLGHVPMSHTAFPCLS